MKQHMIIGLLMLGALRSVQGSLYTTGEVNGSGTSLNLGIPVASPFGAISSLTVSGADSSLAGMTVTLNVAGGYNGSLYAYLSYDGTLVTLLNRVGTGSGGVIQYNFGYGTSGFDNVTLSDTGTGGDIHGVENPDHPGLHTGWGEFIVVQRDESQRDVEVVFRG